MTHQLENDNVSLIPMTERNYHYLVEIIKEKDLLKYSPSDVSTEEKIEEYFEVALRNKNNKTAIPYLIYDKKSDRYAGSTRYGLINWKNKTLHIGWTWLGENFRGTGLNTHIKYLMLRYAFEELKFEKVEFRIDERNLRSRKAVEKLGAKLEGILRKDTFMPDGFRRNSCCYGIIKEEWREMKTKLEQRLSGSTQ